MEAPNEPRLMLRQKGYSLKMDRRVPLPRTALTQLAEHGEVEMMRTWSFHPYALFLFGARMYTVVYGKRNPRKNLVTIS